jgi:hypothetical protein
VGLDLRCEPLRQDLVRLERDGRLVHLGSF